MQESVKPGDRIELLRMPDDPCPVEPGTTGTVRGVYQMGDGVVQATVTWDTSRSLMLLIPPDEVRVIAQYDDEGVCQACHLTPGPSGRKHRDGCPVDAAERSRA